MSETKASGDQRSRARMNTTHLRLSAGQASHIGTVGGATAKPDLAGGF
jgi:hypothetical protein